MMFPQASQVNSFNCFAPIVKTVGDRGQGSRSNQVQPIEFHCRITLLLQVLKRAELVGKLRSRLPEAKSRMQESCSSLREVNFAKMLQAAFRFSEDVRSALISAEAGINRMPHFTWAYPFGEFHLGYQLRVDPRCDSLILSLSGKWLFRSLQLDELAMQLLQRFMAETGANVAVRAPTAVIVSAQ
jgi:hypothetical protein